MDQQAHLSALEFVRGAAEAHFKRTGEAPPPCVAYPVMVLGDTMVWEALPIASSSHQEGCAAVQRAMLVAAFKGCPAVLFASPGVDIAYAERQHRGLSATQLYAALKGEPNSIRVYYNTPKESVLMEARLIDGKIGKWTSSVPKPGAYTDIYKRVAAAKQKGLIG